METKCGASTLIMRVNFPMASKLYKIFTNEAIFRRGWGVGYLIYR